MSARKYDIESFKNDVISVIQSNLSAKVTEINTEKNDNYSITAIDNTNYYNDITDQVTNISPFIYYGLNGITTTTTGAQTKLEVSMFISVVFDNTNQDGVENKALRYNRVLREILQSNYKKFAAASQITIEEFVPADYTLNQGSDFKVSGVGISATITG